MTKTHVGSIADRAIALLRDRGLSMRSQEIAEALDVRPESIANCLEGHVEKGSLIMCKVTSPSGRPTNEYRISAGGATPGFREYRVKESESKKTPPQPVPETVAEAPAKTKRAYKRSAPVRKVQRKTAKKVQKTVCADTRPAFDRALRAAGYKPTGRASASCPTVIPAGTFRAAIASDGAMIFLGAAAGPFELNRGETRAVIDFVRTLDRGEAAVAAPGGRGE